MGNAHFDNLLVLDFETSGLAFNSYDPSIDDSTGETFQAVSLGMVVVDTTNLKPIDHFYVEIQWNEKSTWNARAEQVHGLSKDHLQEHGVDEETAAIEIVEFVMKHFGTGTVRCAGHNIATFDIWFMRRLLNEFGIMFKTGNRFVDTNSIGFASYNTYTSDELFDLIGVKRGTHNALEDALASLKVIHDTRIIYNSLLGES